MQGVDYSEFTVLAADDQPEMAALIPEVVCNQLHCPATVVDNGDDVLAKLEESAYDVLVTDMRMPGVHGIELIQKALQIRPELDIIVMTGFPEEFPYREVIEAGAKDFLKKPFLQSELVAKMIRVFRERTLMRELAVAEKKFRSLFEHSSDGMVLVKDKTLEIEDVNRAFVRLCEKDADALQGLRLVELFDAPSRMRFEQWLKICTIRGGGTLGDLMMPLESGVNLHLDISVTLVDAGVERFFFISCRDVTGKREVEKRLEEVAQKDSLTGLYNKRTYQQRLEGSVDHARRSGSKLSLFMIDLDNFKRCNDTYGHDIGDKLLIAVGNVIHNSIRSGSSDEGFRCGGDEFTVLLHDTNPDGAFCVAQRMQHLFAQIETYGTTMSIGIAHHANGMQADQFIRAADEALYRAKAAGKNTIEVSGA